MHWTAKAHRARDETLYYHDTVYLRAKGTAVSKDIRLELYLDNKVDITQNISGELLTAARLGLRLTDETGSSTFRILTLSDENEGSGNTRAHPRRRRDRSWSTRGRSP